MKAKWKTMDCRVHSEGAEVTEVEFKNQKIEFSDNKIQFYKFSDVVL